MIATGMIRNWDPSVLFCNFSFGTELTVNHLSGIGLGYHYEILLGFLEKDRRYPVFMIGVRAYVQIDAIGSRKGGASS